MIIMIAYSNIDSIITHYFVDGLITVGTLIFAANADDGYSGFILLSTLVGFVVIP